MPTRERYLLPTIAVLLQLILFGICGTSSFFHLLSRSQIIILNHHENVSLECEFYTEQFNLFDNPILWRKSQLYEATQMNMMGNLMEPFASSFRRFKVNFLPQPPRYTLRLTISNISTVDSGNYTCEVNGPHNVLLGIVTHTIFVRGPVTLIALSALDGTSINQSMAVLSRHRMGFSSTVNRNITLTDNQTTRIQCLVVSAFPPNQVSIYVDQRDLSTTSSSSSSSSNTLSHSARLIGEKGLREIEYSTIRRTREFVARVVRDDDKYVKCIVSFPGLPENISEAKMIVNYAPIINCFPSWAFLGDKNAHIRCVVKARPWVTSLYWVLDLNGTIISSGQVVSEYWTLVMDRSDGSLETQLYMRQTKEESFRSYTVVAENSVSISSQQILLARKHRSTSPTLPPSLFSPSPSIPTHHLSPVARHSHEFSGSYSDGIRRKERKEMYSNKTNDSLLNIIVNQLILIQLILIFNWIY